MTKSDSSINLIDLISDKHTVLRKRVGELDGNRLNKTETHILVILEAQEHMTISEISRHIHISRQGTHKCVQGLLAQELIAPDNNAASDHYFVITPKGRQHNAELLKIKLELEKRIIERLGQDTIDEIKSLFLREWLD